MANLSLSGSAQRTRAAGFAVVDVETTGLYPATDRVVEIAIVQLDEEAQVTGEFCTLIDPQRDVGPVRIHGIRAVDVVGAPTFESVAATVWGLLVGRVLVAHNSPFDVRFLAAEFGRCGARLPPPPTMCTMSLAASYLPGLPARSLVACCDAAGVSLAQHHSALDDARGAAGLLATYRRASVAMPGSWLAALAQAVQATWIPQPRPADFIPVTRASQIARRAAQRPPLAGLADQLPRVPGGDTDAYLAVLDRVLEDRFVSDAEIDGLLSLAASLGLGRDAAHRAHREYLRQVSVAAWRDRVVTETERADLLEVARLTGVPEAEALTILDRARGSQPTDQRSGKLNPGDRVVFTGDTSMPRAKLEDLSSAAGLLVTSSVSGKTALVVTADPYSQSGKAQRCRDLGIRMVTEQVFLHLLDGMQATMQAPGLR